MNRHGMHGWSRNIFPQQEVLHCCAWMAAFSGAAELETYGPKVWKLELVLINSFCFRLLVKAYDHNSTLLNKSAGEWTYAVNTELQELRRACLLVYHSLQLTSWSVKESSSLQPTPFPCKDIASFVTRPCSANTSIRRTDDERYTISCWALTSGAYVAPSHTSHSLGTSVVLLHFRHWNSSLVTVSLSSLKSSIGSVGAMTQLFLPGRHSGHSYANFIVRPGQPVLATCRTTSAMVLSRCRATSPMLGADFISPWAAHRVVQWTETTIPWSE